MSLKIRVITPDRIVWNTSGDEVVLPSTTGQLGILTSHIPLMTSLEIGTLRVKVGENWKPIIVLGGFAEVLDDEITVLVNGVEEVIDGDLITAKSALEKAAMQLENAQTDKEKIEASQNLKRVAARAQAITYL
jgi:F-type H+-transporting ATPase subunit epsilon|tara:strand:- start:6883 stop:7281 length:399 start_codon:yes stop_codon:yes gene_type:complete